MKRKYDCPKVKIGDWVYFLEEGRWETEYLYKVVMIRSGGRITVEVNKNKKDDFVGGWTNSCIGNGKYWNVDSWCLDHYYNTLELE